MSWNCLRGIIAAILLIGGMPAFAADETPLVRSQRSGLWSEKETWDAGRVPTKGDRVVIRAAHHVEYDVESRAVIRLVQIAGELEFSRHKNTELNVGLLTLIESEEPTEEGFDCHLEPAPPAPGKSRATLLVGSPGAPIGGDFVAKIRLHYIEGMNKDSCPAIVCCGGRMEFHGRPLARTWTKLKRQANIGSTTVSVAEAVADWRVGDQVVLTSTNMQRDRGGRGGGDRGGFLERSQTEQRTITKVGERGFTGGYELQLDKPLLFEHFADDKFQGEVANLSRNVIVESADPDGTRGHTMFHKHSAGSISYAEFRHLGKRDTLGRYSIHFHLCGNTMRGSSVIGASIWDSHNRWITIHGTESLVVRDCVGFKSVGHGYFLEDGTEVNNILDHNLAALVLPAVPQKEQVIPFDLNRGAGFWFANCQNSFTRNVAADCAEYGYRFDNKKAAGFDPVLMIRQPNGTLAQQDTRVLPFIRFEDNEAHTMRFFCLNLRGVTRPLGGGLDFYAQNQTLAQEAADAIPAAGQPFWIRNFRAWDANWSVHLGTCGVFVDGLDSYRCDVAIWRSIMDRSGFRRMTSSEMRVNDIHNPLSMGPPASESEAQRIGQGGVSSFRDKLPPVTMITSAVRDGGLVRVRGSVADTSDIKTVLVNGRPAQSLRGAFSEWEITLEAPASGAALEVSAASQDVNGHQERAPHVIRVE